MGRDGTSNRRARIGRRSRLTMGVDNGDKAHSPLAKTGGAAVLVGRRRLKQRQLACKPGSVPRRSPRDGHSSWTAVARGLALPTRTVVRKQTPGRNPYRPYSVLLPVGFTVPALLPGPRWALAPPFHPYPSRYATQTGGLLSVALSLGLPPPGVTRHRASMEPGLSSPATFRSLPERPSGRLTCEQWSRAAAASSPSFADGPSAAHY